MLERLNGNRLGGEVAALKEGVDREKSTAVFYASEAARPYLTATLGRFFLYVTPDRVTASKAAERLNDWVSNVVLLPEKDDVLLNAKLVQQKAAADRTSALGKILCGEARGCVISAEGLMQRFPSLENFQNATLFLEKDGEISPDEVAERLVNGGYRRRELVAEMGDFSKRGDILDVWAAGEDMPARIEFFGDMIDSIRCFAPDSMMSLKTADSLRIFPVSDILVTESGKQGALKRIKWIAQHAKLKAKEHLDELQDRLESNRSDAALNWAIPFLLSEMGTVFDYLPEGAAVVLDEPKTIDEKMRLAENAHKVRVKSFLDSGDALPEHIKSMISRDEGAELLNKTLLVAFQQVTSSNPFFNPQRLLNIRMLPVARYAVHHALLAEDVKTMLAGGQDVLVFAGSGAAQKALGDYFTENDLLPSFDESGEARGLCVLNSYLSSGFLFPKGKLAVIGTNDAVRRTAAQRSAKRKRDAFLVPVKGDYVVHETHGIGLSEGVVTVDTRDGKRDYYVVLYKGGDKLYLPVDQMDTLEKYAGGGTPSLHKLGGKEFERVKERVKNSVKKMAVDLVALYEKRLRIKGYRYRPDTVWQKELEDSFEFQATDDQLVAVAEIKEDMEKGKVMDRLLCGDVGFGKTEVAVRAIFKTVIEGKQAAFLSPTTILCQQHYNTVCTRLKKFGLKIDLLSRFASPEYIKEALKRIASGETDIVVATHRLLSKDVVFHDLGLLVLDEEQRFGVEHKERIKVLKNNVNVLALSATPIPRTLHMALSGIRDISTLETPPQNRLPVQTYVLEYTDSLLKDAVRRELNRGGQVFILYNRVQGIEAFHRKVAEVLDGEARVVYAHGQMDTATLEDRIKMFYDKQADVLVSTTIIENGIDLPDANTLIVLDADRLGLSALYQLRGRVGRSHNLAYAYFTIPEGKVLTENAEKRLNAITAYTELGSGFKIAMQDLEIRGAGNILGREQHGNMEKVGYDLYCRLLQDAVGELQGMPVKKTREVEIVVDGDTSLPPDYIEVSEKRVAFYKRTAGLSSVAERAEFERELTDIYGKLPKSVQNMLDVGLVKNLAEKLGVKRFQLTEEGFGMQFYSTEIYRNEGLFRALDVWKKDAVLSPADPPTVVFRNRGRNTEQRLKFAVDFLNVAVGKEVDF